MHLWASKQKNNAGFTIVELLIVVVVIAILAAITIVAYNGIQNRAKTSAAQSALSSALKKINLYAVDNADQYPPSLAAAGITNTDNLQYTGGGSTFCVTATAQNISYFQSNTTGSAALGACLGHGANGIAAITNLVVNPTFAAGNTAASSSSGSQVSTNTTPSSGGPSNSAFLRRSYTAASTSFASGMDVIVTPVTGASPGDIITESAYVRSSKAQTLQLQIQWINSSAGSAGTFNGSPVTLVPNTWTRLTVSNASTPAPSPTVSFRIDLDAGAGAVQWANGDTLDYTMLMATAGPTLYQYADGSSPGWAWTGTANNSTSTGPPL